jgi:hypothetical protein
MNKLTPEERQAIKSLQQLQQRWPPSLWLFFDANSSGFFVMKKDAQGNQIRTSEGGLDQDAIVAKITGIPSDAGLF